MTKTFIPALLALALAVGPAAAQEPPATNPVPPGTDNFTFAPAEGEHLKIDRRTGRVSLCRSENGTWRCALVPDDRLAYEEEVDALEAENQRLRQRIAALEDRQRSAEEDSRLFGPEDEKKLEEFMDFSGHAMRRFFDMVEELKRDFEERNKT